MQHSVIVIGQGEMGGVFSRAYLRAGYIVIPATRNSDLAKLQKQHPQPDLVVVAVNENAFPEVLPALNDSWRQCLVLLQNELLPQNWQQFEIDPTVISVWFEKKPGKDVKVIIPSPVYGKHAHQVADALAHLNIPCAILSDREQLLYQLVLKNVYILTSNIAGLKHGGSVGELWEKHPDFTRQLCFEIIEIQAGLADTELDKEALLADMLHAFAGDPEHQCMGRSAPARLASALAHAERLSIEAKTLQQVASDVNS